MNPTPQPDPIRVRPAEREDADALFALIDALADYEKLDRPDDAAKQRLARDAWENSPPRFWAFLAEEEERGAGDSDTTASRRAKPVGYAIVLETYSSFLARPTLYIEDIFVLPEARGKGAGSALLRFLAGEAVHRNCGRMEWVCLNWNRLAIDFYERRGAEHLSEWRYYRLSESKLNEVAETREP